MAYQRFDKGYDTNALGGWTRNERGEIVRRKRPDPPRPNGQLTHPDPKIGRIPLWVFEVSSDFAISGSTGQSYRTRSFFPHNFVQASYNVMCQCASQEIYGRTVEFIRDTQKALDDPVLLEIVSISQYRGTRLKGSHEGNSAQGYIKSVQRAHSRHEYSPNLQFSLTVTQHLRPADWADTAIPIKNFKTWKEIISDGVFAPDPDDSDLAETPVTPPSRVGPNP